MQLLKPSTAYFSKRHFHIGEKVKVQHLEKIGTTFIKGFNKAMTIKKFDALTSELNKIENEFAGCAYEGAAMALAMKDILMPWNKERFKKFLNEYGSHHLYMINVGAGWAFAKLHFNPLKQINKLDTLLKYLAIDGYGFHHGYFKTRQYVYRRKKPDFFSGYEIKVFYQGLGRSLWFVECADVDRIQFMINTFPIEFLPDLWSGIGLASSYAGGATENDLLTLKKNGTRFLSQLAQGAAFAAKARIRADNLVPHTEMACNIFCETSAEDAAKVTDEALIDLQFDIELPAYEIWRTRIQKRFEQCLQHTLIEQ